jgi:[acyl-carrier-protein] S-malonyltransferase
MVQLLVEKIGYPPAVCMGHSFGQFSALVHSGAVDFIDMAEFVNARTHIINTPEIEVRASFKSLHGMDMDSFERFLKEEGLAGEVEMALHNQKEQIVCAATKSGEEKLHALSGKYNFVIKELLVSRPYHTTFMEEYNQLLLPHIDKIKFTKPHCPVVLNHAKTAITDEKLMQQETRIQMVKPVFWYESVLNIANDIDAFVVVDPGETQFKIIRRITDKKIYNVNNFNAVKLIEKKRI